MLKKIYNNVNLACTLQTHTTQDSQHANALEGGTCLTGVISKTHDGFRFEEAIRKGRPPRNPKLFDGKYISMVKMQNGRYQCHIKTFDPKGMDRKQVASDIYSELAQAFQIIDY